ncbi:helix-turn-helix domain-containing protein [Paenibacillus sp. YYML68]|uniref:helix-turn-helix domain-containing protein n=1 Tax=Paenibacillus sp. YYML68 TaxID=2909250 RepID=UPI00249286E5|nr:helix-turn-helix transcriptional regulator [Paenibacillus sp. YYML68]
MKHVGRRITATRLSLEWSEQELASRCGMALDLIEWIEEGTIVPDDQQLRQLAIALEVSEDYIRGLTLAPTTILDEDVRSFVQSLFNSDYQIMQQFKLTFQGRALSAEETKQFLSLVRSELVK